MMKMVFPANPKEYLGYLGVRIATFAYLMLIVARSLIHLFAADGGAESIAGLNTSGTSGKNLIAIFHQWGAIQLLLVTLMLVLFFAYRGLTPILIFFLSLDAPLRALAGMMGKIESSHTPPGEGLNWRVFYVLVVLFAVSLVKKKPKN